MTILRMAALVAILAWTGVAHADGRRRYHDEAGMLVGLGILADWAGASLLADLIAPPEPGADWEAPREFRGPTLYEPSLDVGTRRSSDAAWTWPWW